MDAAKKTPQIDENKQKKIHITPFSRFIFFNFVKTLITFCFVIINANTNTSITDIFQSERIHMSLCLDCGMTDYDNMSFFLVN